MENLIKSIVLMKLYRKYGQHVPIAEKEWQDAIKDALNDVYTNNLCFGKGVSAEHFSDLVVNILSLRWR
ncbi:hypothetical protein CDQ84_14005 [Clostridium thermosuccinogenes]|uniref:Uncharacterized protein n=1 Tax=Clostridium thermosuccinogenes TaxID=84032 RepID=A0A2K2FAD3_9CLOT|nr:hypothetical protein [Pseudoclostridium thermosuccinogenes]AUS95798.1 hypothetical protein CDO33_04680 [Pseudoclostridium thermosuccinogenes]PNT95750.1 hypothetical protein CDQ85_13875 [Pseudoclostridium thermosuccinogenes]PNT97034.1 hypothetical protein CDQ84_14005 [Pseudoclostridium thermosuccinogenes]